MRGDLDTIVLKALKKEPDERYPTVNALLDDVERYLAGRPVLAQPDSAWYRIGKFTARNRLAVSLGAAVFAALVIGASVAAWQARVARAEQARAQEVKEFIAAVFREADPTQGQGSVLSAAELLRQAERRLQDRGAADPSMRLELLAILGESLFGLQENADAARVTEQALQLQESAGIDDDLLKGRLHLLLSQTYEYLGRNDEALAELDRTFAVLDASRQPAGPLLVQGQAAARCARDRVRRLPTRRAGGARSDRGCKRRPRAEGARSCNRPAAVEPRLYADATSRDGGRASTARL